jgi:hypothetical protein
LCANGDGFFDAFTGRNSNAVAEYRATDQRALLNHNTVPEY